MRHYSVAANPLELGFFGAEAAAEQGYGWQYTYLFFRNQDEAERFGIGDEFLDSLAGSIGELDVPEWQQQLDGEGGAGRRRSPAAGRLRRARHRASASAPGQAAIVSGPGGTRTLQDGPASAQIERRSKKSSRCESEDPPTQETPGRLLRGWRGRDLKSPPSRGWTISFRKY